MECDSHSLNTVFFFNKKQFDKKLKVERSMKFSILVLRVCDILLSIVNGSGWLKAQKVTRFLIKRKDYP